MSEFPRDAESGAPRAVHRTDYRPPDFLADQVDLVFRLDEQRTIVNARTHFRRNPAGRADAPLWLDGDSLTLTDIRLDGQPLGPDRYGHEDAGLSLPAMPDSFDLDITTEIAAAANTTLSGLYVSNGAFFTQCEAEGFRRITFFPDRPDVMARFTTTIVARRALPVLLSNGNPVDAGDAADGRHWAKWEDPHPKPCYLFALVAGDLVAVRDTFRTSSGRDVGLAIWVRRGDEGRCGHAMDSLKRAMRWDEEVFGREYDLDVFNIAAVSDFNMGAMENKGLNIFNTKYVLANPDTATDGDYLGIETVISHEYFHNWTGNRVTCRDWFQLSLKEGLTVFRDQEFSSDQGSRATKRITDVRVLRAGQFREDAGPLAHPVRPDTYMKIDNFYTATVYQKGAEVVRMIHTLLGAENFRRGMDLYFARHDNQAVTLEDFAAAMQDASGIDLSQFQRWYSQAGTPELHIDGTYDADARRYRLRVRQATPATPGQPEKRPFLIPLAIGLLDEAGDELPLRLAGESEASQGTRVLRVSEAEQDFVFEDVPSPPVPSLLRGFSAPVKLQNIPPAQLRFLAQHDTDAFVRWDSGQQYFTQALLRLVASNEQVLDPGILEIVQAAAARSSGDPGLAAEAIAMPGEAYLADQMNVVDVDAIHEARCFARRAIGSAAAEQLQALYEQFREPAAYRIDGPAMGRRAMRNACLAYLVAAGTGVPVAVAQFKARRNMTDVLAALQLLADTDAPERRKALAAFYDEWKGDPLVLDKWFAIQALSSRTDTLTEVRRLVEHPDFDMRNPNRVRAVVGSFAAGNQVRFHEQSGAGYEFLTETVLVLDPINPQIAARMMPSLGAWRRHDPVRQEKMRACLDRIAGAPGISRNTYEMAARALA